MQLKKIKPIGAALSAAAFSMLGVTGIAAAESAFSGWDVETGFLTYQEQDRITVFEPAIEGRKEFGDERFLDFKFTYDSITGASPNGAVPSSQSQTTTTPSGQQSVTSAGDTPMNTNFHDARTALSIGWEQNFARLTKGSFGTFAGFENDFFSTGLSMGIAQDTEDRNRTFNAGISLEYDIIKPTGGIPVSMEFTGLDAKKTSADSNENKTVIDALIGVTQVVSRRMLMQFNYAYSLSNGYLSEPYKVLSIVDGETGDTLDYIYENRPDSRTKHILYWRIKYHFTENVMDTSYRYMMDDWGIRSHTLDFRYRWQYLARRFVEPHLRLYTQSEADFYHHSLVDGNQLPENASADYRLAKFNAVTVGAKFGMALSERREAVIKLEYYLQMGDDHPDDAVGVLKDYDLFPGISAIAAVVTYSF